MQLRPYQIRVNSAVLQFLKGEEVRGQIYSPTGSGKTVCFIETIRDAISMGYQNIAVLHPRIALSLDQMKRFIRELGRECHFTSFHSGGTILTDGRIKSQSVLGSKKLENIVDQVGIPHITFSSYHSFHKIKDMEFDLLICDESHNFVEDRFYGWLGEIAANKILFYTATPITLFKDDFEEEGEKDKYMKNYELFGDELESISPNELIKPGYIVAPLIHQMRVETIAGNGGTVDQIEVIARAYVEQWKEVTGNGMPFAQMLVAMPGVPEIEYVRDNMKEFWDALSKHSSGVIGKIDVYAVVSDAAYKNGRVEPKGRFHAISELKESNQNAVIMHYDTLAEGIDIDTLTGALILRKLSKVKFMQTIGRCGRPYKGDLDASANPKSEIYDLANGIDLRKKPRSIITVPVVDGEFVGNHDGKKWCEAFIACGYDDLWDYIKEKESTPSGRPGGKKGDEDNTYSSIESHMIDRLVLNYEKLFEGGL